MTLPFPPFVLITSCQNIYSSSGELLLFMNMFIHHKRGSLSCALWMWNSSQVWQRLGVEEYILWWSNVMTLRNVSWSCYPLNNDTFPHYRSIRFSQFYRHPFLFFYSRSLFTNNFPPLLQPPRLDSVTSTISHLKIVSSNSKPQVWVQDRDPIDWLYTTDVSPNAYRHPEGRHIHVISMISTGVILVPIAHPTHCKPKTTLLPTLHTSSISTHRLAPRCRRLLSVCRQHYVSTIGSLISLSRLSTTWILCSSMVSCAVVLLSTGVAGRGGPN